MSWPLLVFKRSEYQDMINDTVNDLVEPDSSEYVFGKSRIMNAYSSKYLRNGAPTSQNFYVKVYVLKYYEKFIALYQLLADFFVFFKKDKKICPQEQTVAGGVKVIGATIKKDEGAQYDSSSVETLSDHLPF